MFKCHQTLTSGAVGNLVQISRASLLMQRPLLSLRPLHLSPKMNMQAKGGFNVPACSTTI